MIARLKNEVVKSCGFPVAHRGHCELLSKLILQRTDTFISYNTLRRLWGLAPGGTPQRKTLDALAQFCGYADYANYNLVAPKLAFWHQQAEMHRLLSSHDKQPLFSFLESTEDGLEKMQLLLDTLRHLLLIEDVEATLTFLDKSLYKPEDYPYAYQIHFAASLGQLIRSLPHLPNAAILTHPSMVEGVYLRLVDYSSLQGYFGAWSDLLQQTPPSKECAVFLACLGQLRRHLNGAPLKTLATKDLTVLPCPPPLAGRILTVQVLQHPEEDIQVLCDQLVDELNLTLPLDMTFFHEPLMLALMVNHKPLTRWLCQNVDMDVNRLEHFQLHDLHTHRLMMAQHHLFKHNLEEAQEWYDQVNPQEFLHPACHDILHFPYRRIQAHLEGVPHRYPQDVQEMTQSLGHSIYSEATWHSWFSDVPVARA